MRDKVLFKGYFTVTSRDGVEVVHATDSVAFLIADPRRRVVLLISQERHAMRRRRNWKGMTVEVPAGRRDVKLGVKALIAKEAKEETGMRIGPEQIKLLNRGASLALSPGVLTEKMYLAYVEARIKEPLGKSQKVFGLASEGERITRLVVSYDELRKMVFEDMKTYALVQWFLMNVIQKEGK